MLHALVNMKPDYIPFLGLAVHLRFPNKIFRNWFSEINFKGLKSYDCYCFTVVLKNMRIQKLQNTNWSF